MPGMGHNGGPPLDDDQHGLGPSIVQGTIATVDLAAATCGVDIGGDDGPVVTAPLRWIERGSGATRTWSPPSVGEQVTLLCPGGDLAGALVLRGVRSDANPAAGDSTRELIQFGDGTVLAYDPEAHALEVVLCSGGTAHIVVDGGITIEGDVTITGKLTASDDVVAGDISLVDHVHGNVAAGSAKTGAAE